MGDWNTSLPQQSQGYAQNMETTDKQFREWIIANWLARAAKAPRYTWINKETGQQAVLDHVLLWSQETLRMAAHARGSAHPGHDHLSLHKLIPAGVVQARFQPVTRQTTERIDIPRLMDHITEWQEAIYDALTDRPKQPQQTNWEMKDLIEGLKVAKEAAFPLAGWVTKAKEGIRIARAKNACCWIALSDSSVG
eukprot:1810459-Rhodomonas_salina.2